MNLKMFLPVFLAIAAGSAIFLCAAFSILSSYAFMYLLLWINVPYEFASIFSVFFFLVTSFLMLITWYDNIGGDEDE